MTDCDGVDGSCSPASESRKRLLRVMHDNGLLSPHWPRRRDADPHDRHIIIAAPNVMWAIDATQIRTVRDGKVWLFGVAEHWNGAMLGRHVSKSGSRFEAVQALGMAVRAQFGRLSKDAARGVARRHDHGSNFMADHFQKQVRFWGLSPSFAFGEPQTNSVIERLFRTLKEQVVHGRIFDTIDDVREAVRLFAERYNAEWLIEKSGYLSPHDKRAEWLGSQCRQAA